MHPQQNPVCFQRASHQQYIDYIVNCAIEIVDTGYSNCVADDVLK